MWNCCFIARSWPALHNPVNCSTPGFPVLHISQSLVKFMSTELVMLSKHLIPCHPLLLLPSIFPSIRIFSRELAPHIRWPKYWSFSFSIGPSNEYSWLISFSIDQFDHSKLWEILKEKGVTDNLACLLRSLYMGQGETIRKRCETTDCFKTGKEYVKAVYCPYHSVYLTYMQNTLFEMSGWMIHKLESRLLGEMSTTSDMCKVKLFIWDLSSFLV